MCLQNTMIYLSIHGIKDGQTTFNCGTRYDWYLIRNGYEDRITIVRDEKGTTNNVIMKDFRWLPNYNIESIIRILARDGEERCEIMYDRTAYEADKKQWMSATKNEEFKYPCVHSTPKSGTRYMYSKVNDRGHFGVSKVIFGDGGISTPIVDIGGEYGMTQHAMAIEISIPEEGFELAKVLTSSTFQDVIKSCMYSSYAIDWNIFKDMRKDFWKEFV